MKAVDEYAIDLKNLNYNKGLMNKAINAAKAEKSELSTLINDSRLDAVGYLIKQAIRAAAYIEQLEKDLKDYELVRHIPCDTKREYLATAAMQGLLSTDEDVDAEVIAQFAVICADTLLAELAK